MNHNRLDIEERIKEITTMCDREQPIYEQISNFSIALYVFGFFECTDLLSADDVDHVDAGAILQKDFIKIKKEEIPFNYQITRSLDNFLMVIGDPVFPSHFAVVADMKSPKPYFSKLPFFGSGFDSLEELKRDFVGIDGITSDDISYYRMKRSYQQSENKVAKIYTINRDGTYDVMENKYAN
ncbi:MAG: hypothetical protein ABIJ59_05340 [Pseudomonadota bacterium]